MFEIYVQIDIRYITCSKEASILFYVCLQNTRVKPIRRLVLCAMILFLIRLQL